MVARAGCPAMFYTCRCRGYCNPELLKCEGRSFEYFVIRAHQVVQWVTSEPSYTLSQLEYRWI